MKYIYTFSLSVMKGVLLVLMFSIGTAKAQFPPVYTDQMIAAASVDQMKRVYLTPQRIVWTSGDSLVQNADELLKKGEGQAYFGRQTVCRITNKNGSVSGLILDFGKEIQGGVRIMTSQSNRVTRKVRLRFGESVSETCSDVIGDGTTGTEGGATNHHAMRDFEITLPGYGNIEVGNTGFRFLRIDLAEPDAMVAIKEVKAIAVYRDIPYVGSFKSSDDTLNKIWETGAYTVHLCMQDYLWDGIKRDRMVWGGDMHPEVMTINSVFGYNEVVPETLDFLREHTPLPAFMNGIPSYSMWWIIMQHDWYMYQGDLEYLSGQKDYLTALLDQLTTYVAENGEENLRGRMFRFLDWPSVRDTAAIHAGIQALMVLTFEKGSFLCSELNEPDKAEIFHRLAEKMKRVTPDPNNSNQAGALLAMAGILNPEMVEKEIIMPKGADGYTSFFGYYMLQAQALAGNYQDALNNIRQFWGGMLKLGATTFWEEFNLEEAENAAPIDDIVPQDMLDYHYSTGANCYIGLRRSLCHGWSAGPTPWLSENVLGIKILEPGCKKIKVEPHLGDLQWAEGTFPTPKGVVYVKHTKKKNGKIVSEIKAPEGVEIVGQ
ncbi:alpha-L-rhamnosidase C-terminal domain-containing protein [Saccharicrinis sp. FJH54]|uniref:alpha-L-rhamnosidase-related protein n=1 Tax=Saccharicrinis sp. FJH54 TaxID=3344665 RepID=UPI0035D4F78B